MLDTSLLTDDERRLIWRCRRGLKELDVIIGPFVEEHYQGLDAASRARFARLMECEDMDLFNWFLRQSQPADPELEQMVEYILGTLAR